MIRLVPLVLLGGIACGKPVSLSPAKWPKSEYDRFMGSIQNTVRTTADVATGTRGAVTVAYGGFAARAGLETLKRGGNAADAALTTALTQVALTAGAPISYFGIMSLVYYDAKTGKTSTMSAGWNTILGETAPLSIPGELALSEDKLWGTVPSGRTALVGGFMKGVEAAHRKFGKLPFASMFDPAIHIAEAGMPVTKELASEFISREADLKRLAATRAVFMKPDGTRYLEGERFRQPALARTLRMVAARGADYLYRGPWGEKLVRAVQADGGKMTMADLAAYQVTWSSPRIGTVGDYQIYTVGAPNYGGLNLIEAQHLAAAAGLAAGPHWSASGVSLRNASNITNAWMLTLFPESMRASLYPGVDFSEASRLTPEHARRLWPRIADGVKPLQWAKNGSHSDDVVVIDEEGNMAAITHSINCVIWGKTAINVDGISIGDPGSYQQAAIAKVGPGKPLPDPTETGLLVKEGKPVLAFASMGSGLHQRTFQALLNVAVFGMTVDQAIDAPDFFIPTLSLKDGGYLVAVPKGRFPKTVLDETGSGYREYDPERSRFGGEGVWVGISRDPRTGRLRAASHNRSNSAAVAY